MNIIRRSAGLLLVAAIVGLMLVTRPWEANVPFTYSTHEVPGSRGAVVMKISKKSGGVTELSVDSAGRQHAVSAALTLSNGVTLYCSNTCPVDDLHWARLTARVNGRTVGGPWTP